MLLAILGLLGALAPIVMMFLDDRGTGKKERKEVANDANKIIAQGVADHDLSALTLGNDRLGGL